MTDYNTLNEIIRVFSHTETKRVKRNERRRKALYQNLQASEWRKHYNYEIIILKTPV